MHSSIKKLLFLIIIFSIIFLVYACKKETPAVISDYTLDLQDYYLTGTNLNSIKGNVVYSDGSKEEITADVLNISGVDFNTEGTYSAVSNYNGIEKTFIFKVKTLYTINFVAGVGGLIEGKASQQGFTGEETEVVEAVASEGYKFTKWNDNTRNNFHQPLKITGNKEIIAVFEPIKPTLSFYSYNISSGQFSLAPSNTLTSEFNGSITVPSIEIEGYDFKGFTIDSKSAGLRTTIDGINNIIVKDTILNNVVDNVSYYPIYVPVKKTVTINKVLKNSLDTPIILNILTVENYKSCDIYKICLDNFASGNINTADFNYEWIINDGVSIKTVSDTLDFTQYYINNNNLILTLNYFYKQKALTYNFENQNYVVNVDKFQKIKPYTLLINQRSDLIRAGKNLNCNYNNITYNEVNNSEITITEDIIISVNWTDILYTVNFIDSIIQNENKLNPTNPQNDKISVISNLVYNQKVLRPDDSLVNKANFIFKGWFYDLNGQMTPYNFDNLITKNIDIYACYLVPYTINFSYGTITLNYYDNSAQTYIITAGAKIVYFDYNFKIDNATNNYNSVIYVSEDNQYLKLQGNLVPVMNSYIFEGWYVQKYTEIFNVNDNITTSKIIYALLDYEKFKLVPSLTSGNIILQCCEKKHDYSSEIINVNDKISYYKCNNPECTTFKTENVNGVNILKVKRLSYIKIIYTMEKGKKLDYIQINSNTVTNTATEYLSTINQDGSTTISFKKTMDDTLFKVEGDTKVLPIKIVNSYMNVYISVTNALNKTVYNNVTISASTGQFTTTYNSDVLLTFIANDGFSVQSANISGTTVNVGTGADNIIYDEINSRYYYTIKSIQSYCSISITTVERYHNISINQNFSFTKIVKEDFITADTSIARYNTNKYITFKPETDCEIISIKVNNLTYYNYQDGLLTPQGADNNLIFDRKGTTTDYYLTIKNISKNYVIDVIYSLKEMSYKVSVTNGYLTKVVINNEQIALANNQDTFVSGDRKLTYGMPVSTEFTKFNETYTLDYININGEKVSELPSVMTNNYDINIVFKKIRYTMSFEVTGQGNNYGKYYVVKNTINETVSDPITYDCFLNNPNTYQVIVGPPFNYEILKVEKVINNQYYSVTVTNNNFNVAEENNNVLYIITLKLHEYSVNIAYTDKYNCSSVQYGDVSSDNYTADSNGKKSFTVKQPYYTSRTLYINIDDNNAARLIHVIVNGEYELIKPSYEINNIDKDYNIDILIEKNYYTFENPLTDNRYTLKIQYKNELNQFVDIDFSKTYLHGTVIKLVLTSANYSLTQMNITYANLNKYTNYVTDFVYPESYIQYDEILKTYTCHFNLEGDILSENINFTLE